MYLSYHPLSQCSLHPVFYLMISIALSRYPYTSRSSSSSGIVVGGRVRLCSLVSPFDASHVVFYFFLSFFMLLNIFFRHQSPLDLLNLLAFVFVVSIITLWYFIFCACILFSSSSFVYFNCHHLCLMFVLLLDFAGFLKFITVRENRFKGSGISFRVLVRSDR